MKKRLFFFLLSAAILLLGACSSGGGQSSYSKQPQNNKTEANQTSKKDMEKIQLLNDATVGNYLADSKGMTLYYFTKDTPGVSNCTGQCLQAWPAYYGNADSLNLPASFNKSDFSTITRTDSGKQQITYKGYPLYYYTPDQKQGDVKGQNVNGVWFIVNSDTKLDSVTGSGQKY